MLWIHMNMPCHDLLYPEHPTSCDLTGTSNPDHFFLATQDRSLRAAVDRVPGGASIFASVNGLHLQVHAL